MILSLTLGLIFASLQMTPVCILSLKILTSLQLLSILIGSQIGSDKWHVDFNPSKSKCLLISRITGVNPHPSLYMHGVQVSPASDHKHLGSLLSGNGTWQSHFEYMKAGAWKIINIMRKIKFELDRKSLETIYLSFIRPILEYADIV